MLDGGGWPEEHQAGDGLEGVLYEPLQLQLSFFSGRLGYLDSPRTCFSGLLWEKQEGRHKIQSHGHSRCTRGSRLSFPLYRRRFDRNGLGQFSLDIVLHAPHCGEHTSFAVVVQSLSLV